MRWLIGLMHRLNCAVSWHYGHIEREIDSDGTEWLGLRCVYCGGFHNRTLSAVQGRAALRSTGEGGENV